MAIRDISRELNTIIGSPRNSSSKGYVAAEEFFGRAAASIIGFGEKKGAGIFFLGMDEEFYEAITPALREFTERGRVVKGVVGEKTPEMGYAKEVRGEYSRGFVLLSHSRGSVYEVLGWDKEQRSPFGDIYRSVNGSWGLHQNAEIVRQKALSLSAELWKNPTFVDTREEGGFLGESAMKRFSLM